MATTRICSIPGCGKVVAVRGYCNAHYHRWQRHRDPLGGRPTFAGEPKRWAEAHVSYDKEGCLTWPFGTDRNGYGRLTASGPCSAHRFLCEAAHGPPPSPHHEAAHLCGNGHLACVNPRHLRWATHKENEADRLIHGTRIRGERQGTAKLTETCVREIRSLRGLIPQHKIAKQFSISQACVSMIVNRQLWAWLE